LGDRDQEDHSSKSAQVVRPYLEKKPSKKGLLEWLSPKKKKKNLQNIARQCKKRPNETLGNLGAFSFSL
jgi:hypothetical protein